MVSEHAAENGVGVYLLGFRGPMAGAVPPPGFYFQNDVYYYNGLAGGSRELPFNGLLLADIKVKMVVDVAIMLWSMPIQIAGGNLAFSATLPFGGPSVDAGAVLSVGNQVISKNLHSSITTFGDPFVSGFVAWHASNFHWNAESQ